MPLSRYMTSRRHQSPPSITMAKWSYAFIPLYDFKASPITSIYHHG